MRALAFMSISGHRGPMYRPAGPHDHAARTRTARRHPRIPASWPRAQIMTAPVRAVAARAQLAPVGCRRIKGDDSAVLVWEEAENKGRGGQRAP